VENGLVRVPPGRASLGRPEVSVMPEDKQNQDAKDKIAEGMSEAGKPSTPPTGSGKAGGSSGPQQRSDEMTEGMSEAGKNPTEPLEDQAGGAPS
jgi:hypothetical protein